MTNTNQLIQNNFSKAAHKYLSNAEIQVSPALKIINLIRKYYHDDGIILDLGSGPGTLEHDNSVNYPMLAFDLSLPMLKIANSGHKVNGEASKLPFATNSFSLIISNLMIQWPADKAQVLAEAYRVLKPGGTLILTTLIKPSLHELQYAWQSIDTNTHTLEFLTSSEYSSLLINCGLNLIENLSWHTTIHFPTLSALLRHFKATGTNLAKSQSNLGLGGKRQLQQLENAYQLLSTANGLPLTYAHLLIVAVKSSN